MSDCKERISISGGRYRLGLTPSQIDRFQRDHPLYGREWFDGAQQQEVDLEAFDLARYPVTTSDFCAFLADLPEAEQSAVFWQKSPYLPLEKVGMAWRPKANYSRQPMSGITFQGAQVFAAWAGGRLPTPQEWEVAARGGTETLWPWGAQDPTTQCNHYDVKGSFPEEIRPNLNDGRGPTPVDFFAANAFGFKDMVGNLWEWCRPDPPSSETVPLKGGSWNDIAIIAFLPSFQHAVPRNYHQTYCFGMRMAWGTL